MARITTSSILAKKQNNQKITMITSYDYSMASLVDEAGIDMILVGDSLGNVTLGYDTTLPVTMDDMVHHTRAVSRAAKNALVVADMPFLSYHISVEEAVRNAGRLIQEGGAQAVKLEGGEERLPVVKAILDAEIPIVGHIGLTPQSVNQFGGFKVQGKDLETARKLIRDAKLLEEAGVFAITLEGVPGPLAQKITESLSVPTIGIGAGKYCDGQVLVIYDALGMTTGHVAKFVKKFANLEPLIHEALREYIKEVEEGTFPGPEHTYTIKDEVLEKLY
ncbi:MAG TPA: 3-methyl-2-oxobutanoate hydroxymethyltransferase [Syntrophomonadaceae bacterium]|nr:3-methyl-2-oxobutanoate hydroxymethyltransferase [Syntrophomonadaceae bacterium]